MKTVLFFTGLFLIFAVGCQPQTVPPAQSPSPATSASQPYTAAPAAETEPEGGTDRDQPADPGMTTAHDKTLQQEKPSGDESSQAAPNDGDAEPPQESGQ